jgi:Asp/Glu/hydantoin racemase
MDMSNVTAFRGIASGNLEPLKDLVHEKNDRLERKLASEAVAAVATEAIALGASSEQATALAEAMQIFLIRPSGYSEQAHSILVQAGLSSSSVDHILEQLELGLRP